MNKTAHYTQLKTQLEALRAQMKASAADTIREGLREVFDAYPSLTSLGWKQFTPYFNDGDPCVFGVNTDDIDVNGLDAWEASDEDYGKLPLTVTELDDVLCKTSAVLNCLEKEDFRTLFGDHCRVTLSRDGDTYIEEYDHD